MGMYGGDYSAPQPDERIGKAAMKSARIGGEYLDFMRSQADIANEWATEDRGRYKSVYEPLQDAFIAEAQGYDTPERRAQKAMEAQADVAQQAALADEARKRDLARMGVDPTSGRYAATARSTDLGVGLAKAGAANLARRQVEAEGRALRADAVNLGSGFAVNPATSLSLANGASSSGFGGAMAGQQQKGSLLNTQYQQQLQSWQANQQASSSMWGGIGSLAGLGISMLSSKDAKTDKRPARGVLEAVRSMPVEEWTYKAGAGDEGRHIGPYAEDFQAATGRGDGSSIPVVDAIGVTMKAVQELADKVDTIAGEKRPAQSRKPAKGGAGRSILGVAA